MSGREKDAFDGLREKISKEFGVRGALSSPPHVTLFRPFETTDVEPLLPGLEKLAGESVAFTVALTKFAAFGDMVWFVEPEQDRRLFELKERIGATVAQSIGARESGFLRPPHFHVTLAYKDVFPAVHGRIGEFLKSEPLPIGSLTVDNITLFGLKSDGGIWEPVNFFSLRNPSEPRG